MLARKCRADEVSRSQVQAALSAARRSALSVPIEPVAVKAVELALDKHVSVHDALYVALADELQSPTVPAGRRLIARLRDTCFAALLHALDVR